MKNLTKNLLRLLLCSTCLAWVGCSGVEDSSQKVQQKDTKSFRSLPCIPTRETCNGRDDDCNGVIDDNVERSCRNDCGIGVQICERGSWGQCLAGRNITEICNGKDDNCNGLIDEGVGPRLCSTACSNGYETCINGVYSHCNAVQPKPEICDGLDNDCNGLIDDGLENVPEICNGKDDNCDGQVDEGLKNVAEICNGKDDNCDGCVDENARCGGLKDSRLCIAGSCRERCQAGSCPSGQGCDDGICFPSTFCARGTCPNGMTCVASTQRCVPTTTQPNVCSSRY